MEGGDVDGLLADVVRVEGGDEVVDGEAHGECGEAESCSPLINSSTIYGHSGPALPHLRSPP